MEESVTVDIVINCSINVISPSIKVDNFFPDFMDTMHEFDENSDMPNGFITKCPSMYDNERRIFDNLITESINQHGICLSYYITTFDTDYDRIWGEDNDRRFVRTFDFMGYYQLPREDKLWSKFGIEGMDSFSIYVSKIHFEDASTFGHDMVSGNIGQGTYQSYIPKVGDIIIADYNKYIYEISEIKEEVGMFLLSKQHVWEFVVRTYKNEHIEMSPDTSASMPYIDYTNKAKDIFNINSDIDNEKEDVEYKPKINEETPKDPFAGW